MKILQLIDSLETGGAERMAVNYANALSSRIEWSGLAVSRKEGGLKEAVSGKVRYFFLRKRSKLDLKSVLMLRKICRENGVDYIHAHSSSWFLAVCVKMCLPSVKIVWHDHYGLSEFLHKRQSFALGIGSLLFSGIISVNQKLKDWALRKLNCSKAIYLPNFSISEDSKNGFRLKGQDGKRILCLANLRPQKDHLMLLEAFARCNRESWTLHLVGKDFQDSYSDEVRNAVAALGLSGSVFIYGALNDVGSIIEQCEIGVLSSESEGLPVSLIEYGFKRKAALATRVGEIPAVIEHEANGFLCEAGNPEDFARLLGLLMTDEALRQRLGANLFETVNAGYSEQSAIDNYLNFLKK